MHTPETTGFFGKFGGQFVPETVMAALEDLASLYTQLAQDPSFWNDYSSLMHNYAGRPTPLTYAKNLTAKFGGAHIWLKREDLLHTGAHKLNNAIGQLLVAQRLGKNRIVAETGAGQHGVATATACALFGKQCVVYMGEEDTHRQAPNVFRMKLLGAEVIPVTVGSKTLKDATSEAIRDWVTNVETTHYVIGSTVGPHPYPLMVRNFHRVIGLEAREQFLRETGTLPDLLVACVGGGSNALGLFHPFLEDEHVAMLGVEAGGTGTNTGEHCRTLQAGFPGVLHGSLSYLLQDEFGQVSPTHSISAGLDYPGVGPEHSFLKDSGRVRYTSITDAEALEACFQLCRVEGILPALESSHALAATQKVAAQMSHEQHILVNLSGRGDKDLNTLMSLFGE